jgi:hypothetical protein
MSSGWSAFQSSPVTQQAVVTCNAGFDRFFCSVRKAQSNDKTDARYISSDDHCFTVQQRELVFRFNPKYDDLINRPGSFNGINDMALKVFSSANRFPSADRFRMSLLNTPLSTFSRDAILRSSVSFVGVALQPVDYMNTNSKDTVAVQVAGSCTVWNTGTKVIRPGMKVIWDFPSEPSAGAKRKQPSGEPQSKLLFMTMPLESAFSDAKSINHDFVSALFEIHDPFKPVPETDEGKSLSKALARQGMTAAEVKEKYVEFTKKALILYEELRSRVIGIALSGAAPGEVRRRASRVAFRSFAHSSQQFDLMMCSGH